MVNEDQINLTPMMRQYFELKNQVSDAILLFRMGDFYEIFGEDALEVAPKLELVLTSREKGKDQDKIPFCGVPHHSAKNYWLRLLKLGYKVAIGDQVEDPKLAKGIVKREITRVLTPGCIDELEGLDSDAHNYLMGIYQQPGSSQWTVLAADISTGEMRLGCGESLDHVIMIIEKFKPHEIVVRRFFKQELQDSLARFLSFNQVTFSDLGESILRDESCQRQLYQESFGATSLGQQPCGNVTGGLPLVAAVLEYFQSLKLNCSQFLSIRPLQDPDTMILDEVAVRDLEIFETVRRRSREGTVFHEMNRTATPMGARLLRDALAFPLLEKEKIVLRQDAVEALLSVAPDSFLFLQEQLRGIADLERLMTRVVAKYAQPVELIKIKDALARVFSIAEVMKETRLFEVAALRDLEGVATRARMPFEILDEALAGSIAALGSSLDVFREGFDHELDRARILAKDGQQQIDEYEQRLRQQTGINSLKVREHKSFGLLIEITKSNLSKVPESFIRRQTMVNCERYITPELQELSESLSSAHQIAIERELDLYRQLLERLLESNSVIMLLAAKIAHLDLLMSFARKAKESQFTRAQLSDDGRVELWGSRHPVVERYVGQHNFIPNDIRISPAKKHLLVTGPNMGGKSTIMRQVAICAILNQIGSFVPAHAATLPLFDRVFTRVGAADDLARGQSTFMVEMAEAAHILREATASSLVILDEIGRGTSTQDGMALASAILEDLVKSVNCYTMFATHYHELVPIALEIGKIELYQMQVVEDKGTIAFSHRMIKGASGCSFGLEVAKIAGIPSRVMARAKQFLDQKRELAAPAVTSSKEPQAASLKAAAQDLPLEKLGLHQADHTNDLGLNRSYERVIQRIREIRIHRTTPLQALNILNDLKVLSDGREEKELFTGLDA
jgi:DNA mismatch repair protein MutS